MSDSEAACWTVAIVVALLGLAIYLTCRAVAERIDRRERRSYLQANWDEATQRWSDNDGHQVGPDPLQLLADVEADLKAYGETLADLYDTNSGDR